MIDNKNLYTTFFFGAGASYGSQKEQTPPLGTNLLYELQKLYHDSWGTIPPDIAPLFNSDFEQGMKKMIENHPARVPEMQRKMSEFFYRFQPHSDSLYIEILNSIKNNSLISQVKFVTLNYERLLELSAHSIGLTTSYEKDAVDNNIEICFPHGCCNFFCKQIHGRKEQVIHSNALRVKCSKPKIVNDVDEFKHWVNSAEIPVMSFYEENKSTPFGGPFIIEQRKRMAEIFNNSKIICIVGIRIREHDEHIWESLKSSSAKIVYCSGAEDGNEFMKWSEKYRPNNQDITYLEGFFSDNIKNILYETTLTQYEPSST